MSCEIREARVSDLLKIPSMYGDQPDPSYIPFDLFVSKKKLINECLEKGFFKPENFIVAVKGKEIIGWIFFR